MLSNPLLAGNLEPAGNTLGSRAAPRPLDRLGTYSLWLAAIAPALFVICMVQIAAITVPWWDHCGLHGDICNYFDGNYQWSLLWRPHGHARIFTYRLVFLANAILTRWDLRSEYLIHLTIIVAGFVLQGLTLWRMTGRKVDSWFLRWLVVLSLIYFSPVGHHNHWYTMHSCLTLANLFSFFALAELSLAPQSWRANVLAALACWLATYSVTNGLIAVVCCGAIAQLTHTRPWRPNRLTLFWLVNLVVILALYLPGLDSDSPGGRPTLLQLFWFTMVYVGAPLRGLIDYPFRSWSHLPTNTALTGITGVVLLVSALAFLVRIRSFVMQRGPGVLLGVSLMVFAIASGLLTGWGRATFVANVGTAIALSSRYAVFQCYLLVGLFYVLASWGADAYRNYKLQPGKPANFWIRAGQVAFVLFLATGAVTYARSVRVYRDAADLNIRLCDNYIREDSVLYNTEIYPSNTYVVQMKASLRRLGLGPYRPGLIPQWIPDPVVFATAIEEYPKPYLLAKPLTATFDCPVDSINAIDVYMGSDLPEYTGQVYLSVESEDGKKQFSRSRINVAGLHSNAFRQFVFTDLEGVQGLRLRLVLLYRPDAQKPGRMFVWVRDDGTERFSFQVRGR